MPHRPPARLPVAALDSSMRCSVDATLLPATSRALWSLKREMPILVTAHVRLEVGKWTSAI